ncbi:MFS transporter [Chelativorans intermedius]|uniref:MFS transporter n=1 Tax=Chelativorans intermedius TaxID=515947 RepID=A0ABV6DDE8_9HYPH|nr:MFS transporter [Chelativorans intermedius]MCT9000606.1 MFS transporter [Chelativorans intermedius]
MNGTTRQAIAVGALGFAQTLAWGSTYYLPAILAGPMARELGVPTGMAFAAFSAALVVAALLGPFAGRYIDRFGGRDVLTLSNLIFAAGLALLGAAQGTTLLFAAWLVIGAGMAVGLYEAAFSTLTRLYGHEARGAITGVTLIAGFASTVCWPASAWLEGEFGWRMACFVWAAAHIVIGLPLNRLLVPATALQAAIASKKQASSAPPPAPAGQNAAMALLAFVFAATWFTSTTMAAHLPGLLRESGAAPATAIVAAALVGPAQVAGRLLEFGFLRRFHPLLSARLAAVAHPLGALVILGAGAPAAMVFAALHGAGNGVLTIAKGTLPLAIFGPDGYGFRQGLLMVPARFAQAGAPFLFALLMERYGASALLLTAALGAASFAALLLLNPSTKVEHV